MKNAGRMFAGPALNSKVIKPLDGGAMLYPTATRKAASGKWPMNLAPRAG